MKDKPVPPTKVEETLPTKSNSSCFFKFVIPMIVAIAMGVIGSVVLLNQNLWFIPSPNTQEIDLLKSQTVALDDRLTHLEKMEGTPGGASLSAEQLKDFEGRLAALQHQMEDLERQPKMEGASEALERSQTLEKGLTRLIQANQVLKETILFWRLKAKVLSDAPFTGELAAFKEATKTQENLSTLEKYADLGLHGMKLKAQGTTDSPSLHESSSVWTRLKASVQSSIKIEKVDPSAPDNSPPTVSQDRKAVEEVLSLIEQTLMQKLNSPSLFPSPQPGDAL